MEQYINSNKEYHWGDWYFKSHVMAPGFDYKAHKKEMSPYYEQRDFKVSMMFADYFSRLNGIISDRYLSMDVYYFYVIPSLNRYDFKDAYLDKNIYCDLFPDVKQPVTVIKNMHGIFYCNGDEINLDEAIAEVSKAGGELMIKPTVETCNGEGVEQIRDFSLDGLRALFSRYGFNFIVQEKVKQHPDLQQVNATSLNSMRLYTYRHTDGSYEFLYPFAHMRFGGKGSIKDNVSQGGGTCLIRENGEVDDKVFRFKSLEVSSLKQETGVEHLVVPNYQGVIDTLLKMHRRLPYFDFVGWDVTVLPSGDPLFIEFNLVPSVEGPQMMAGPMFGDSLEEVLGRARQVECSRVHTYKKLFGRDLQFYLHMQ